MLAKRLKELRNGKHFSQSELARLLGLSKTGYANYEQGIAKPPIDILILLSEIYSVSTDYILGITDVRCTQDESNFFNEIKDKDIDQLIHEYNITLGDEGMDQKEERILIKLIKSFMEE